ncbi:hypothetical protein PRIPAC_81142, partial [Pristionchus pacificus]|uniref:Hydrolase n=1 Tax=Pristionchus pacificus TaxID=54126 RepID=A0A2A6BDX1_PRIPA
YERIARNGKTIRIIKLDSNCVFILQSIPFAAPPIGELRWKLPQDPNKWDGILEGTKYSAACLSNHTDTQKMDEDCLYLNVYVSAECRGECPIILMFHGGAMNFNSAVYYNDDHLIENFASKGIMLVVPAFRLGFMGIFNLGDDFIPTNLGLHDALHALQFVSKEAVNFGGNKDALTLMGHSYGGTIAGVLAYSSLRREKVNISRLIMMSPSFQFTSLQTVQTLSFRLVEKSGCSGRSSSLILSCLKSKDAAELLRYQSEIQKEDESISWDAGFMFILMSSPLLPFSSFTQMFDLPPGVDVVIGSTAREMDVPVKLQTHPGDLVNAANLIELEKIHEILVENKNGTLHTPAIELIFLTVHKVVRSVIHGGNKAFVYSYQQPSSHNYHSDDFSFIAGVSLFEQDNNEKDIAKFYPELFSNFTLIGIPSPDWMSMNESGSYFSIVVDANSKRTDPLQKCHDSRPKMLDGYERESINYWENEAPKIDIFEIGNSFEDIIKSKSITNVELSEKFESCIDRQATNEYRGIYASN